jgi:hypothetical protein
MKANWLWQPTRLAMAAVLVSLVTAACAASRPNPFDRSSGGGGRTGPTVLVIDNLASQDMTVFILPRGGVRERLGLATGLRITRFTLPERIVPTVRTLTIEADPIGSTRSAFSDEIVVSPGDTIGVQIPSRPR